MERHLTPEKAVELASAKQKTSVWLVCCVSNAEENIRDCIKQIEKQDGVELLGVHVLSDPGQQANRRLAHDVFSRLPCPVTHGHYYQNHIDPRSLIDSAPDRNCVVAFLDAQDVWLSSSWLSHAAGFLSEHNECGAILGNWMSVDRKNATYKTKSSHSTEMSFLDHIVLIRNKFVPPISSLVTRIEVIEKMADLVATQDHFAWLAALSTSRSRLVAYYHGICTAVYREPQFVLGSNINIDDLVLLQNLHRYSDWLGDAYAEHFEALGKAVSVDALAASRQG